MYVYQKLLSSSVTWEILRVSLAYTILCCCYLCKRIRVRDKIRVERTGNTVNAYKDLRESNSRKRHALVFHLLALCIRIMLREVCKKNKIKKKIYTQFGAAVYEDRLNSDVYFLDEFIMLVFFYFTKCYSFELFLFLL